MNQKHKFRASYTVLNTWHSGNWERAIEIYFKLRDFVTPQMKDGRDIHQGWEDYIKAHKALPPELGGKKLINPKPEFKAVVEIYDWLDLVGKIDCFDEPTIIEFKTGKMSSEAYASSMQCGVYGVLATYAGLYAEKIEILHYDQYTKKLDTSYVWLTDEMLKKALNWIETIAGEMHSYFEKEFLYDRFGKVEASKW